MSQREPVCLHCGKAPADHVRLVSAHGKHFAVCPTSVLEAGCPMCARPVCQCKVSEPGTHPKM
jgi:hypothetical protein